jgi:hypothetical protein
VNIPFLNSGTHRQKSLHLADIAIANCERQLFFKARRSSGSAPVAFFEIDEPVVISILAGFTANCAFATVVEYTFPHVQPNSALRIG